ncbi:MAG: hypothetical protein ACRD41_07535 [Candidatus Acidiferrales bacterium]
MKRLVRVLGMLVATMGAASVLAQSSKYPSLSEYMMEPGAEAALAKSAAPENISSHATIKILTASGFKTVTLGDNGFVCLVMRGWSAPTFTLAKNRALVYDSKLRAPICFDPVASRTVLPYQELRTKLGMEGKDPDGIAQGVATSYASGELPKMEGVSFAYMWSADSNLGPGVGAWHPHMMVYAPYYKNSMLGVSGCGEPEPCVSDDAGTPFAVVIIPVHGVTAIKSSAPPAEKKGTR